MRSMLQSSSVRLLARGLWNEIVEQDFLCAFFSVHGKSFLFFKNNIKEECVWRVKKIFTK